VAPKAKRSKPKRAKSKPAKTALNRAILTAIRGTSRIWTVEDLMVATQCTDQELLNCCCDELINDGHLRPKLLPLRLTPEQVAEITKTEEESRRRRCELDDANAIRDGLRERRAETGKVLDRAAALEKWGPPPSAPVPPPSPPKKTKKAAAVGRPLTHNYSTIQRIAGDVAEKELESVKAFFRAVRNQCKNEGEPPPGDTLLKKLARPLYKRPKSQ
jgi:hypothetical protein